MESQEKALTAAGLHLCTQKQENHWEIDARDRLFLALTLLFCVLLADTVLFHQPGAGITAAVLAWYALLSAYCGRALWQKRESRVLLAVNLFLGLTFALTSDWYFRFWNFGALLLLIPVQALSAPGRLPWWRASMLTERLRLLLRGVFGSLGASLAAAGSGKQGKSRQAVTALLGLLAAAALAAIVLPVLAGADALFAAVTEDFLTFCREHLTTGAKKLCLGLAMTPFVFGLLYRLRRPEPHKETAKKQMAGWESLGLTMVLGVLCGVYLLFIGVQFRGLLGGQAYLAEKGISYAEWARSGFFQMVGVTVLNLAVLLTALTRSRRAGRGWKAVRLLSALLAGESLVLLISAAWRMSLYVAAYGLSFLRCMTYWGMGMMAVFLLAALWKSRKPDFAYCRVAFAAALAGWVLINCLPVNLLVARNQVNRYLAGDSAAVDVSYLAYGLSHDALSQLKRLDGEMLSGCLEYEQGVGREMTVEELITLRRQAAAEECGSWESWNLSAWLAARG